VALGLAVALLAATACSAGGRDDEGADEGAKGPGGGGTGIEFAGMPDGCDGSVEAPSTDLLVDACGRVVILRGTNVESSAKGDSQGDDHLPASGQASQKHLSSLGWNSVRFLIFWGAVEPTKGRYDEAYLDVVEDWLDLYARQGVHVVLDMHQDIYGWKVHGNGAPDWAVLTDGLEAKPPPEGQPWYLAAVDPATQVAYQNFWDPSRGHPELREHFLDTWRHVAERFADHPAVIGYDILNEPVFANGDLDATLAIQADAEAGRFHNTNLTEFSQQAIDAVRSADDDAWIMIEPTSLVNAFPYPGDLVAKDLHDPRKGEPRLAYAPHLYEPPVHDGNGYAVDSPYVGKWEGYRVREAEDLGATLYVGEFGGSPDNARMDQYLDDVLAMADRNMLSWAQWSWDPPADPEGSWSPVTVDGKLTANGERLARVYPRAIAGVPEAFSWDPNTHTFRMTWRERDGVEGPTELGVPLRAFHAVGGIEVGGDDPAPVRLVLDGKDLDVQPDAERGVIALEPTADGPTHEVCVHWGSEDDPC